jgi:hypothetical protein
LTGILFTILSSGLPSDARKVICFLGGGPEIKSYFGREQAAAAHDQKPPGVPGDLFAPPMCSNSRPKVGFKKVVAQGQKLSEISSALSLKH